MGELLFGPARLVRDAREPRLALQGESHWPSLLASGHVTLESSGFRAPRRAIGAALASSVPRSPHARGSPRPDRVERSAPVDAAPWPRSRRPPGQADSPGAASPDTLSGAPG